jgi:hypothetical protein
MAHFGALKQCLVGIKTHGDITVMMAKYITTAVIRGTTLRDTGLAIRLDVELAKGVFSSPRTAGI